MGVEDARTESKELLGEFEWFKRLVLKEEEEDDAIRGLATLDAGFARQKAGFQRSASGPVGQIQGVDNLSELIQNWFLVTGSSTLIMWPLISRTVRRALHFLRSFIPGELSKWVNRILTWSP